MPDTTRATPVSTRSLGQVIGVEKTHRAKDNETGTRVMKQVQVKTLTAGHSKVFTPNDPDSLVKHPEYAAPDEHKEVALTVEAALQEAVRHAIPAVNITATKDRTNQRANADIIVRGAVLVPDVPVSHLLWLEHYLSEWRKFMSVLPVLDAEKRWERVDGRTGLFRSDGAETPRFVHETVPLVLHPGTEKHAPIAEKITKDTHVGRFAMTHFSGAVTEDRKRELVDRADELLVAVKDAVARANRTQAAEEIAEGGALFGYLLNG